LLRAQLFAILFASNIGCGRASIYVWEWKRTSELSSLNNINKKNWSYHEKLLAGSQLTVGFELYYNSA